jgi:hypothetical protein
MPPHAARCVARHGVRSQAVPVALVGECGKAVISSRQDEQNDQKAQEDDPSGTFVPFGRSQP